eukprot:3932893-Rhodomonas_salina.1
MQRRGDQAPAAERVEGEHGAASDDCAAAAGVRRGKRRWPRPLCDGALRVRGLTVRGAQYRAAGLTWADLITLAGIVAVEEAGSPPIEFCGGMTDLTAASALAAYAPLRDSGPNEALQWRRELMGLTAEEVVALMAMQRSDAQMKAIGRRGSWSTDSP